MACGDMFCFAKLGQVGFVMTGRDRHVLAMFFFYFWVLFCSALLCCVVFSHVMFRYVMLVPCCFMSHVMF